ncbi:Pentatricopeptide repeat [Parasponia andersonii]|uniref:Pentatricopeptide repeat n=1 Tax=Parasponia andersonii TaxID=3476 RepID=A0A2P5BBW0_PARAD|nr:Pentatricopeptide repeat [Parasponia andersonii]
MVGGALLDVYAKLWFLDLACELFWNLDEKDIMGQYGLVFLIIRVFIRLEVLNNEWVSWYPKTLQSCKLWLHSRLVFGKFPCQHGLNALIGMYAKCGVADYVPMVFKGSGCIVFMDSHYDYFGQIGQFEEVLWLFRDMLLSSKSTKPTNCLYCLGLYKLEALSRGEHVHGYAIKVPSLS